MTFLAACWGPLTAQGTAPDVTLSETVRAHFSAAQEAQQRRDYTAAEREYRAVLAELPNFAEVRMNLGLLYQLQDRIPEAMAEFHLALKVKPTLAGANFFLGVDYCKSGNGAKAISYLKAASRQEPNRPDIWSWLATAQEISGDYQAEVTTLKHALSLQSHDVDMLYLLGHTYETLGRREVTRLEKAAPASSWSEQLLAESYSSSTEWSFAVIRFQNALALTPNRPELHVRLGEVFLHTGRLDQAGPEFEQELRISPNDLRAIVRRGEVKLIQGDTDAALEDWTRALPWTDPELSVFWAYMRLDLEKAPSTNCRTHCASGFSPLLPRFARVTMLLPIWQSHFWQRRMAAHFPMTRNRPSPRKRISQGLRRTDVVKALDSGQYSGVSACLLQVLTPHSSGDFRIKVAQALFELGEYESALEALSGLSNPHSPPAFIGVPAASKNWLPKLTFSFIRQTRIHIACMS